MAADETYDVLLRVKSEGDEQLKQLSRALVQVQQTAKATGNQLVQTNNQVAGSTDRMRFGFQNLGFQVQDFAVQVGGGTSALRAFSQQMPQAIGAIQGMLSSTSKLGAFLGGPWGVALGVAAAALGPLIAGLFDAGEAAETAGEKIAKLRGEVTATAVATAQGKLDEALTALYEANKTAGREAALTARTIELSLPALREALTLAQGLRKAQEMGLDFRYQKDKVQKTATARVDHTAENAAKKAADDLLAFRNSIADVLQEQDKALAAYIDTLNRAVDPTIAYKEGLEQLAEAQAATGLTAEAAAAQQDKLYLALIKGRDAAAGGVGDSFSKAMEKLIADNDAAAKETTEAWQAVGDSISDAFGQLVAKTSSVRDVVRSLVADILQQLAKIAIKKFVAKVFTSAATAAAKGNVFDQRGMVPFAQGGVVTAPTIFPFAGGTGLMGEAGPEAIMPLQRDAQGKLGVAAAPVSINVINNAGAAVSVKETGPGQIEIFIARAVEASRAAIAQDFRRGGSDVSRSVERTYGVNRAAGAF